MDEILSKFLDDDLRIRIVKDVIRMSDNESIIDEFEQRTLEAIQEYDTQKYIRKEALREGRSEGIRQGREEGIEEGIEQGIEQGIAQGIQLSTISIIKSMISNNMNYKVISDITGKSIKEIKEIERTIQK